MNLRDCRMHSHVPLVRVRLVYPVSHRSLISYPSLISHQSLLSLTIRWIPPTWQMSCLSIQHLQISRYFMIAPMQILFLSFIILLLKRMNCLLYLDENFLVLLFNGSLLLSMAEEAILWHAL